MEDQFQDQVAKDIANQNAGEITIGLTENEYAVIIEVNGTDAAFTADEAREFAQGLKSTADQRWNEDADHAVEYIRHLADVVDGEKAAEEVEKEWKNKDLNP